MNNFVGCVDDTYNQCELFSSAVGICKKFEPYMVCDRTSRYDFHNLVTEETKILEIGPYINPYFKGQNVKYFDVMTSDEIKEQVKEETNLIMKNYASSNANLSKIPNIDFVDPTGDLSSINEKFDVIFSSHNIEHQIDLISHLKQIENLLEDNGRIFLLIPDKRFCFDHFVPETPLSEIIESYYNHNSTHPLRTVLAMECETAHNSPGDHFKGKHGEIKGKNSECYKEALKLYNDANGKYINTHRWRFTPQQFAFVIKSLKELDFISLEIEKLYLTKKSGVEFYSILKK